MSGGAAKTNAGENRYTFFVEWWDQQADLVRRYQITYFLRDQTLEMHDVKNRRPFLKRGPYGALNPGDLFLGAVITLHGRQLKLVEYADVWTRSELEGKKSRTLCLVKPDAYSQLGKIVAEVHKMGFTITKMKMVKMTAPAVAQLYPGASAEHVQFLTSDVVVAMEVYGDNAIAAWRAKIGEVDSGDASCLRRIFGSSKLKDAVHGSESVDKARDELELFFGRQWPTTAVFNNCTCAVIRPHALQHAGAMLDAMLSEGFEISALEMVYLSAGDAEEFLDVYKGVVPTFHDEVKQLTAGPCIAMEIRQEDAVNSLRQLVGPHDPEVARHLRPASLRGKFGEDRVKNGIHCSDLPEDGLLEVEYFFQLHSR